MQALNMCKESNVAPSSMQLQATIQQAFENLCPTSLESPFSQKV